MRRSHGGSRSSSATSSRSASGPPSTRRRPPREPSTRIASPCPTSRTVTRATVEGRLAATAPVMPIEATRAYVARRMSRAWRVGARPIAGVRRVLLASPAPARPPRVAAGRDRRRQAIATPAPIADASPRAAPTGGSSTTLAKGSVAAASTIADHEPQRHPARGGKDGPDDARRPDPDEPPADEGHEPGGHGRRDERHDDEVDGRGDERRAVRTPRARSAASPPGQRARRRGSR